MPTSAIPYRLLIPHWVLMCAIQMSVIAIPLIALDSLHANAQLMGYLNAAGRIPSVLFGLGIGAMVDRSEKRTLMMMGIAGSALSTLALALLVNASMLDFMLLLALALVGGIFSTLYDISFSASVANMATTESRADINHANQTAVSTIQLGGPTIAAILVSLVGAPTALLADVAMSVSAICFLSKLPTLGGVDVAKSQGVWDATVAGVRYCAGHTIIRRFVGLGLMGNFLYSSVVGLVFLHARNECHLPVQLIGISMSVGAAGFLIGAFTFSRFRTAHGDRGCHIAAVVLTGIGWGIVALSGIVDGTAAAAVLIASGMFCTAIGAFGTGIVLTTLRQQYTTREMQGRVSAFVRTVSWIGMPVGAVLGGLFAERAGTVALFTVVAFSYIATVWAVLNTHKTVGIQAAADADNLATTASHN